MQIEEWLSQNKKTQAELALIIRRDRVRAHRIAHGAIPNKEEMQLITHATGGAVTANDFYGIEPLNGHKRKRSRT